MSHNTPWARVKNPAPIPPGASIEALQALPQADLGELIRSHLLPRDQSGKGRELWERLWRHLGTASLCARALDILEDFTQVTEDALSEGRVPQEQEARAEKFLGQLDEAWNRLVPREDSGPLAWAGKAGDFQPSARKVIAQLVGAVAAHRSAIEREGEQPTEADEKLWATLRRVSLDPRDYPEADID